MVKAVLQCVWISSDWSILEIFLYFWKDLSEFLGDENCVPRVLTVVRLNKSLTQKINLYLHVKMS